MTDTLDPDFFIIGAQKSGTTSLYEYIKQFAANYTPPLRKEIHYYDYQYHRDLTWYRSHYPFVNGVTETDITGEATPYYLFHPLAPRRVEQDFPDARFVVLLKKPVERAYSHYHFQKANSIGPDEPLTLEEVIRVEEERLEGEFERLTGPGRYRAEKYQYYSYLARGRYASQLKRWLERFDREQFHIVQSARFFSETGKQLERFFDFLDLEWENYPSAFEISNAIDYPDMDEEIRQMLRNYYESSNRELFELIGKEFNWN
ncbi:MAG: sulfotransferase domain-containing protein [Balneolaceae bacterium]|nr:sulfotransferase domain-containing protein [Balneolaceae bacterium]